MSVLAVILLAWLTLNLLAVALMRMGAGSDAHLKLLEHGNQGAGLHQTLAEALAFGAVIFTTKAEYGVRVLIQLGLNGHDQPVALKAIAEAEQLPLAYLERIAALLKRSGLIVSTRGAHGGYLLAKPAEEITMDEVVLALEGAIAPMECFVEGGDHRVACNHGEDAHHCATKLLWTRVQLGVIKSLQRTTLAELVAFSSGELPAPAQQITAA